MAVPLHAPCGRPIFLPPGYTGALCDCRGPQSASHPAPAAAPSPAAPRLEGPSLLASEGRQDGGRGARDGASVSTGRGGEKPSQPSRGPIEAAAKDLPDDYKPDRDAQERAEGWFRAKFFKSKGIGDEWKKIVAACKTWGMPPDEKKWRDWLKGKWESERAVAVKVLITAGEIEGPKLATAEAPAELKALLAGIAKRGSSPMTLADIQANIDPKATQAQLDKLLDLALIYEPKVDGGYVAVDPKGG